MTTTAANELASESTPGQASGQLLALVLACAAASWLIAPPHAHAQAADSRAPLQLNALTLALAPSPAVLAAVAAAAAPVADAGAAASDPADSALHVVGVVSLGAAGTFAVGTLAALIVRQSAASHYNSGACLPDRSVKCADDADRVRTMQTLAIVSVAAAGGLSIFGLVALLASTNESPSEQARASCNLGLSGVACAGTF